MAIFYRFSSPYVCVCVCLYTHTCGVFAYFWGMQDSAWYLASGSHLVILIEEMNEQSTDRGKPQWHGITWTGIWDRRSEKASQGMKMWMNLKVKESPTSWVGQERAFLAWGEMYVNKRAVLCLAAQLCPTLCDSIDCSPPGSSVHGDSPGENTRVVSHVLLQGIFQPRDQSCVSHITGGFFPVWATREGLCKCINMGNCRCLGNFKLFSRIGW